MCRIFALVGVELMFESLSRSTIEISTVTTACFSHTNGKFSRVRYQPKALDSSNHIDKFTMNFGCCTVSLIEQTDFATMLSYW